MAAGEAPPFHSYTMKQAIQEGFILDVLALHAGQSYYKLVKKVEATPSSTPRRPKKKLRRYVRGPRARDPAQGRDHGRPLPRAGAGAEQDRRQARAMVVTNGIERAIQYFHAIAPTCGSARAPKAIVAFSGEHEYGGKKVTEATLNGFPSARSPTRSRRTRTAS
jgi:type I restriction enzyme R subunit